jgi:hypothetical protein
MFAIVVPPWISLSIVMPGLDPGIHLVFPSKDGLPGQAWH